MGLDKLRPGIRWVLILVAAAFLIWIGAEAVNGRLEPVSVVGLLVALVTLYLDHATYQREKSTPGPTPGALADDLAATLNKQWREETRARQLRDPAILPLAWARIDIRPSGETETAEEAPDFRLHGNYEVVADRLAKAFRGLPIERLLLLGQPGAGKSVLALLLQVGLLRARAAEKNADEPVPVPVLVSMSSWDPRAEDLRGFIVRSMATSYYSGREDIPGTLFDADLLLPVLDGLDELPEYVRGRAVDKINAALAEGDRSVVVTCRTVEYLDLIRSGDRRGLWQAAAFEVQPLRPRDVATYLKAVEWSDPKAWDPIIEELSRPDSPVAEAYSTPLMVSVARTVYQRLGGDPAEQLRTGDNARRTVENNLIGRLVEAAYAPVEGRRSRWKADDARRYLTVFAEDLYRHRARDLHWWQLAGNLLSSWVALVLGLSVGVITMIAVAVWAVTSNELGQETAIEVGAIVGGAVGLLVTLVWYAGAGNPPGRLSFAPGDSAVRLRPGLNAGVGLVALLGVPILTAVVVAQTLLDGWSLANTQIVLRLIGVGVFLALATIAALAVHSWLQAPPGRAELVTPTGFLRQDRWSALAGAAIAGVTFAAILAPGLIIGPVLVDLAVGGLTGWAGWPDGPDVAALRGARTDDLVYTFYGDSTLTVAAVVVLPALIFGFLILETRAWFRYQVLRAVLAARRELPWRLTRFLEDSREVDLLRHAAGAYQFRHVRLQEQLADENLTDETARVMPRALVRIRRALVAAAAVAVTVSLAVPLAALPRDRSTRTIQLGYGVGASEVVINAPGDVLAIHTGDEVLLRALPKGERIKDIAVDDDSGYPHFNDTGQVLILNQPGEAGPSARPARAVATHNGRELTTAVQGQDLVLLPGGTGYGRISYGDADEESVLEIYDDYGGQLGKVRGEFADQVLAPRPNEGNSYEPYVDDGPPIIFSGSVAADAVTVWDVRDPEQPKSVIREAGGLPSVEGVNASGSRMMIQADDGVRLFDVNTGARVSTLDYDETSSMPSFSPDGSRIVGITGGLRGIEEDNDRLRVWKAESGEVILDRPVPLDVQGTIMDRDDRLLIIDTPGPDDSVSVLEIFSIVTGRPIRTLKNVRNYATTQSSSASRMQIEISDPGSEELERVEIIDLKTGSVVTDIDVGDFEVSVDSDDVYSTNAVDEAIPFILGSRNEGQEMAAWNAVTGASVLPAGSEPWDSYRISPRGDMFVAEDDDALTLYKATGRSTGRKLANDGFDEIDVDSDRNDSESKVRFSPDGAFVAGVGSGDEEVQAWDAHTGCPVATLSGHAGASLSLTWGRGPSAHTLVTSGQRDDTVRLWKMPSGRDC